MAKEAKKSVKVQKSAKDKKPVKVNSEVKAPAKVKKEVKTPASPQVAPGVPVHETEPVMGMVHQWDRILTKVGEATIATDAKRAAFRAENAKLRKEIRECRLEYEILEAKMTALQGKNDKKSQRELAELMVQDDAMLVKYNEYKAKTIANFHQALNLHRERMWNENKLREVGEWYEIYLTDIAGQE